MHAIIDMFLSNGLLTFNADSKLAVFVVTGFCTCSLAILLRLDQRRVCFTVRDDIPGNNRHFGVLDTAAYSHRSFMDILAGND